MSRFIFDLHRCLVALLFDIDETLKLKFHSYGPDDFSCHVFSGQEENGGVKGTFFVGGSGRQARWLGLVLRDPESRMAGW